MAGTSTVSQSRRRPKRQRTPTTIYTDDNPTTFTTKKKRGRDSTDSDGHGHGHAHDHSSDHFSPRSKTSGNFGWQTTTTTTTSSAATTTTTESEGSDAMPPPAPVVKRGPGRPPRKKPSDPRPGGEPPHHPHHTRASANNNNNNNTIMQSYSSCTSSSSSSAPSTTTITPNKIQSNKTELSTSSTSSLENNPFEASSPEPPTPVTSQSLTVSLPASPTPTPDVPVVVKRKRGRPPKNKPKEGLTSVAAHPVVEALASPEGSPEHCTSSKTQNLNHNHNHQSHPPASEEPEAVAVAVASSESYLKDLSEAEAEPEPTHSNSNCNLSGRRSLPEKSSTTTGTGTGTSSLANLRNRRSLDSMKSRSKNGGNLTGFQTVQKRKRTSHSHSHNRSHTAGGSPLLQKGRANSSATWTPPQRDIEGTFVGHSVTLAPMLPPVLVHDNNGHNNDSSSSHNNVNNVNDVNEFKEGVSVELPSEPKNDHVMETPLLAGDHDNNNNSISNNTADAPATKGPESNRIRCELRARYPAVFGAGIPKSSSSLAMPFSAAGHAAQSPASFSKLKGNHQSQHHGSRLPTWTPLYDPPVFFDNDYDEETGKLDLANTMPVTRRITALTVRKPDHDYLVLGDSVGFVTIYSLGKDNVHLPIAQLESVACQQRGRAEQERLRADVRRRTKARGKNNSSNNHNSSSNNHNNNNIKSPSGFGALAGNGGRPVHPLHAALGSGPKQLRSILLDTSDTTIHALGMIENRVVLATSEELECLDVPSGTSLWVCPLSPNRFVTSLDMHLHTFDVLVSCSKTNDSSEASASAAPISPLMLLQHSKDNVEICDANSPMLVRSPSCSAIWDSGAHNRLLFIALSSNRQEHELVLVSGGSIDSWKVACKTKIPTRGTSATATTKLSQSPGGLYTLVASSRGIRLYETESLQLIHVYGDQLALHGQSVLWKDCWLAGSYYSERNHNFTKAARGLPPQWLQCEDVLGEKIKADESESQNLHRHHHHEPHAEASDGAVDDNDEAELNPRHHNQHQHHHHHHDYRHHTSPDLPPYIIGVPHTKGPKELCENLHVWKVEQSSAVPTMSIPLPSKSEGALGLVGGGNKPSGNNTDAVEDRIVLVTNDGKGHLLLPKMESNFAGIMYPPGYQVVTDNIEYIEEEDALDHVVACDKTEDDDESGNDSGNDDEHKQEGDDVDVFGHSDGEDDGSMDEELKEAMRQSLLEHKKHEIAREAMKHDTYVDILVPETEKEREYLPCRPEPYLRQMINTQVEDDGATDDEEECDTGAKSERCGSSEPSKRNGKEKTEPVESRTATDVFVSNVLDIMPNMQKPKPLEEDCMSFTTTKVVVAVNLLPSRPGRGRKSRAANLETMLKASINPYLQSMMLSKQGVAVNGQGSKLRKINSLAKTASSTNGSYASKHKFSVDIDDTSRSGMSMQRSSSPMEVKNDDEAAVVLGLLGLSPRDTPSVPSNSFVFPESKQPEMGISASHVYTKGTTYIGSPSLALLGTKSENNQVSMTCSSVFSSDRDSPVEGPMGATNMTKHANEQSKPGTLDKSCSACRGRHVIHSCGRRSLPIDYEEIARAEREKKEKEEEEKKRIRAEKRRLADQRRREAKKQKQRELEEKRQREEQEEKERLEIEERRRLQVDFAAPDLNRQRRDQIVASYANHVSNDNKNTNDMLGPQTEEDYGRNSLDYGGMPQNAAGRNHERSPLAHSSQMTQNSRPQILQNGRPQSAIGLHNGASFGQFSQAQTNGSIFEQAAQLSSGPENVESMYQTCHSNQAETFAVQTQVNLPASSGAANSQTVYARSVQSSLVQDALPSVSATMTSIDALMGLAKVADNTTTLPVKETNNSSAAASNSSEWSNKYSSYGYAATTTKPGESEPDTKNRASFSASHGFDATSGLGESGSAEIRQGIPSYATLRGQINHEITGPATTMTNTTTTTTATSSLSNGFSHQTGESQSYLWSTRPER